MEGNGLPVACGGSLWPMAAQSAGLLELVLRKGEKCTGDGRSCSLELLHDTKSRESDELSQLGLWD
jgi:hypothetical protein